MVMVMKMAMETGHDNDEYIFNFSIKFLRGIYCGYEFLQSFGRYNFLQSIVVMMMVMVMEMEMEMEMVSN